MLTIDPPPIYVTQTTPTSRLVEIVPPLVLTRLPRSLCGVLRCVLPLSPGRSRQGVPFTYLLRAILEQDSTLDEALERITTANRTCDLILGVGDGKAEAAKDFPFRSIEYSASVANIIGPDNLQPVNDTWHAPITDVVYHGMDWLCPGYSVVLGDQLNKFHGNITVENAVSDIIARTQTGNLHIAVYDLERSGMYVSFAAGSAHANDTDTMAYERQFTKVDLAVAFA